MHCLLLDGPRHLHDTQSLSTTHDWPQVAVPEPHPPEVVGVGVGACVWGVVGVGVDACVWGVVSGVGVCDGVGSCVGPGDGADVSGGPVEGIPQILIEPSREPETRYSPLGEKANERTRLA